MRGKIKLLLLLGAGCLFPHFAAAQQNDSLQRQSNSDFTSSAEGYGGFQLHPAVGILQNRQAGNLVLISPEFSFGGKLRLLLAPAFLLNDSVGKGYFLAGMLVQHKFEGLLLETRLAMNIRNNKNPVLQIGFGAALPLSRTVSFKINYTAMYERNPAFSGNIVSAGLVFRAD